MGNNATLKGTNSSETQGRKHQSDASDPIETCKKPRLSAHASAEECAEGPFTEIPLVKPEDGNVKQEEEVVVKDRKSTRLNSSHSGESRMPSSA